MRVSLVAIVLLIGVSPALPHQTSDARKAMDQMEKQFVKAFMAKDAGWFEKVSTPDFVAIDQHGKKFDKKQAMTQMKELFQALKIEKVTSNIKSLKTSGKSLLVVTETILKGTIPGKDGKPSKLVDTSTDEETWVKSGKDWKIKLDKTTSDKATLDGKPFTGM